MRRGSRCAMASASAGATGTPPSTSTSPIARCSSQSYRLSASFHDYELAVDGGKRMSNHLDAWRRVGVRRFVDFREMVGALGMRLRLAVDRNGFAAHDRCGRRAATAEAADAGALPQP